MIERLGDLPLPAAAHRLGDRPSFEVPPDLDDRAAFAFGVDLFHAGCLWEAHEVWEGLWRGLERESRGAHALRGLIQAAAAGLKARAGRAAGVASLVAKALAELEAAGESVDLGGWRVDLADFAAALGEWAARGGQGPTEGAPATLRVSRPGA